MAGTTTTTNVLTRVLSARDLHRLEKLAGELIGKGSPKLQAAAKPVVALRRKAGGSRPPRCSGPTCSALALAR